MTQQTAPAIAEANGAGSAEQVHPDAGTGTLDERLARIVGTLKVTADAKMKAGGQGGREFSYATIDQMAGAIGPLLAAERVTIAPVGIEDLSEREIVRQKEGDRGPYEQIRHMTAMTVVWRVAAAGESFEARSRGKAADSEGSEKDTNQAHSFARINLYKSLFHLVTGEDPERKTSSGGSGGGGRSEWSGELPPVTAGAFTGSLEVNSTSGEVGIRFRTTSRDDQAGFDLARDTVKQLGARWNGEGKLWILPADLSGRAVAFAAHFGLAIPSELEGTYEDAAAAPTGHPGDGPVESEPPPPAAPGPDDDIPF